MSTSPKSPGIDQLGVAERLALIEELWESIEADRPAVPVTAAQREELDWRVADHESHPDEALPWDDVKASLITAAATPERFPRMHHTVRCMRARRFPCSVALPR